MTVAIPVFNGAVAPCFEVAHTFLLAILVERKVGSQELIEATGCEGFGRIQLIRDRKVNLLICNGIKSFYHDLLNAAGIRVISGIVGAAGTALENFCAGEMTVDQGTEMSVEQTSDIPLEDLICWTRELFTSHGYQVHPGDDTAPFPIDLTAEYTCPVCARTVRVAICCGAHAYRPEQEIQSLHHSGATYDVRVYVRTGSRLIEQQCDQYGIELIDPDSGYVQSDHPEQDRIPILLRPIPGHERASLAGLNGRLG